MSHPLRFAAALGFVLLVAGCTPVPTATPTPSETSAPSASPTPTVAAPAAPEDVDPASFLLEGTPGIPDADGMWKGHYGFFTDASKTVRCDVWIFSGDSGGVTCAITPGNEALRTYTVPVPTDCDPSSSNPTDGNSLRINFKVFETGSAGFSGCGDTVDPALAAVTKVLLDNQTLHVDTDHEKYTCTVAVGVASCSESSSGASIRFGTSVAEYQG